jgi:leader peptidase (prepilin peptidase)/N-methyltransferase
VVIVASEHVAVVAVVALFGLVIGSFVNVVIARLPERKSLWRPGSSCPRCGVAIRWRDNVPVLSFVLLRGRCRACRVRIAWRYPIVEAATAALWVAAALRFGVSAEFAVAVVLLTALVAVTAIDLSHQIIPDRITIPGIVTGALVNLFAVRVPWIDALIGIVVGGGIFFVIILVSGGGMGGGDMKLGAMLGAFLGWKVTLVALLAAVTLGGGVAVVLLLTGRVRRRDPIPFGPFLAIGGAIGCLWGEAVVRWYVSGFLTP